MALLWQWQKESPKAITNGWVHFHYGVSEGVAAQWWMVKPWQCSVIGIFKNTLMTQITTCSLSKYLPLCQCATKTNTQQNRFRHEKLRDAECLRHVTSIEGCLKGKDTYQPVVDAGKRICYILTKSLIFSELFIYYETLLVLPQIMHLVMVSYYWN